MYSDSMSASAIAPAPSNAKLVGSRRNGGKPSNQCWDAALLFISQWMCGAKWKCSEDYMGLGSHEIGARLVRIEQGLHCIRIKLPAGNLQQAKMNLKNAKFITNLTVHRGLSHMRLCARIQQLLGIAYVSPYCRLQDCSTGMGTCIVFYLDGRVGE